MTWLKIGHVYRHVQQNEQYVGIDHATMHHGGCQHRIAEPDSEQIFRERKK